MQLLGAATAQKTLIEICLEPIFYHKFWDYNVIQYNYTTEANIMKVKNSWWKWCSYPRHSALWCKLPHCPSDLGAANCSDTHGKLPATAAQTLAAGSETEREMSHLQMVWMMLRCTGLLEGTVCYLQTCALVWERGAEKGGDNAHDGLSNVALQNWCQRAYGHSCYCRPTGSHAECLNIKTI